MKTTENNDIYVLSSTYILEGKEYTEVNAVHRKRSSAVKMGKWLINQDEHNGRKYVSYKIDNFFII